MIRNVIAYGTLIVLSFFGILKVVETWDMQVIEGHNNIYEIIDERGCNCETTPTPVIEE